MKYSLVICKNRKLHEIDLPRDMIKTKDISAEELKKLDEFTYHYVTENDFLDVLTKNKIVPEEFQGGYFDIAKIKNNGSKRTRERTYTGIHIRSDDNLIHRDDPIIDELALDKADDLSFNIMYLRSYYISNVTNVEFMKKFISYFFYAYNSVPQFATELNYLMNYLCDNPMNYNTLQAKKHMSNFISEFQRDYPHLRKLAMFRINYEYKIKNRERKEELEHYKELLENESLNYEQLSDIEDINAYLQHEEKLTHSVRNI